jgi:thrombospondin motif-containing protein 9
VENLRHEISTEMNSTVGYIKDLFIDAKDDVSNSLDESKENKKKAQLLYDQSQEKEANPTVLDHAKKSINACDYDTENLQWKNNKWDCVKAQAAQDCIAAPDEYRYQDSKGNWVCAKHPSGGSLTYYYVFRGYSDICTGAHTGYEKLYDCVYKNKLGKTIQVDEKLCAGKAKPTVANKICPQDWTVGKWGSCSKTCGTGTQYRTVTCQAGYDCSGSPKPATSQSCNTQKCKGQWTVGPWSKCSATVCETKGTQTRSVTCAAHLDCSDSPKPATSQSCSAPACSYGWSIGTWGSCSKTCGGGTQSRSVKCVNLSHSSHPVVSDSKCKAAKPSTSQSCNTQTCVTYTWHIGAWKGCTKTCGGGTNTRDVYCKSSTGARVSDSYCHGTKPTATVSCNTHTCVTYKWYAGNWGSCSKTCGGGTQSRTVYCQASTGAKVSDGYCAGAKPKSSQSCNTQACMCLKKRYGKLLLSCASKSQSVRTTSEAGCGVPWIIASCDDIEVDGKVCVSHSSGGQNNGGGVFGHAKPLINCESGYKKEGDNCVQEYYEKC